MVLIIAEIANSHEGNLEQMLGLIDAAKASNTDAVKFQIFKADLLSVRGHSSHKLHKQLEFDGNKWKQIISYAHKLHLLTLADVFDFWGLQLAENCKVDGYKIHSTIFREEELMAKIASTGKPVFLGVSSTSFTDISRALETITKNNKQEITLVHGFQSFPTKLEDTNLSKITSLKEYFKLKVGFADHVDADSKLAMILPLVAIGCGAEVIEKHLTLDRSKKGIDYNSALNPDEFLLMVNLIREVEKALSTGNLPSESESKYLERVAKKIIAAEQIGLGEFITPKKLAFKRSEDSGLFPNEKQKVLYKKAKKIIDEEETITVDKVENIRIVALIAVRMKSTRLPKKALVMIEDKTLIEHIIERLKRAEMLGSIVLCTSTHKNDKVLLELAEKVGVKSFAGSEDDVLDRFIKAAKREKADVIVRVTGDNPLIDPHSLDKMVRHHLETGADFTGMDGFPIGTSTQVVSLETLKEAHKLPGSSEYSEYMTAYIKNPEHFKVNLIPAEEFMRRPHYRLTVDTPEDLELMREIYKQLYKPGHIVELSDVIKLLDTHPELVKINANVEQIVFKYK